MLIDVWIAFRSDLLEWSFSEYSSLLVNIYLGVYPGLQDGQSSALADSVK